MEKFILNPAAYNIDFKIKGSIQNLETEGFDFNDFHTNTSNALSISIDEAMHKNYRDYEAVLELHGQATNINTFAYWYNYQRNENTEKESTVDDAMTIKNIINMLEEKTIFIKDDDDLTTDENGNYVPTFIKANVVKRKDFLSVIKWLYDINGRFGVNHILIGENIYWLDTEKDMKDLYKLWVKNNEI